MISQIQRTFQLHFRVVFVVLLAVVIVAFVFTIGSTPGLGRAGSKTYHHEFFGLDLGKPEDSRRLRGDAELSITLRGAAHLIQDGAQLETYGLERVAALALADQLKIPAPTKDELAAQIQILPIFRGADGKFDPEQYARFRGRLKTDSRVSETDIARVLGEDVRVERLQNLLAGPGYVLPVEVRDQLQRAESTWTIAVATLDYAGFKPDIPAPDDAVARYFKLHAGNYEIPARTGVDYVEFRADYYLDAVKVTDDEVRAFYDANPARFPKPEEKKAEGEKPALPLIDPAKIEDPNAAFALVRPQVERVLWTERAKIPAARAAADLTVALFEQKVQPNTPPFEALLAAQKLTLKHAPLLNANSMPSELGWTPEIAAEAVRLREDQPVSDVLSFGAGSLVLFWRETRPAYQPQLVEVHDRVVADYRENERRKKFIELGQALHEQIEARLKADKKFEEAASAAQAKLEVKVHANFTLRTLPKDIDYSALTALDRLEPGQVSEMIANEDRGLFVHVQEKKAPELAETNPQYAVTRRQLAQVGAAIGQGLYLGEVVERELKKGGSPEQ